MATNAAALNARLKKRAEQTIRTRIPAAEAHVARRALELVVENSPVKTGDFRGNWRIGIGAPDLSVGGTPDKEGARTIAEQGAKLDHLPPGEAIYLSNADPAGPRLEHGWSGQAPRGVLGVSLQQLKSEIASGQ